MRPTSAKLAPLFRGESSPERKSPRPPRLPAEHKPDKPSVIAAGWRLLGRSLGRYISPRTGLTLLAVAVVLTASAHFLEREWAGWLGQRVPASWVQAASTNTLQRLDATVLAPSALPADRQNTINTKFAALRIPQGETPLYALIFRHGGPYGARSFTLAGGQIIVTDELVMQSGTDRALLAALTIQLGHLQNHDALRSSVDHAPMGMLLALFRGDARAGTRLMSDAQPVLAHEAHCEEEARQFSKIVMQANP